MTDESNPYRSPHSKPSVGDQDANPSNTEHLSGKLVVLSTFVDVTEAHQFRSQLEANGIAAKVANEATTAIFGPTLTGPSSAFWIEVLIMESDSAKGLEIKNQWDLRQQEEAVEIPEWICQCGETVDAGFSMCWNCDTAYIATKN